MDIYDALTAFETLSQETRLKAFLLLVEYGVNGVAAGVLSEKLNVPHNTLSFHLKHMNRAGLITSQKKGRSIIYKVNFDAMQNLIRFMIKDCCNAETSDTNNDQMKACSIIELLELKKCCNC